MEKQFYSKSQMQPKAPFKDIYNRYVIPKDTLDENNIQKLFQIIEEGNLGKIREFLMSGNVSVNVRLETGDTLAHVVIKNQNLTERTKTDICNFLVQQGAPIDLPNKYNITPLHLACKYQLLDIIKIFIKSGANMSAVDNNGFTILHYFIMSDIYECKTERNTKVGSFKTKLLTRETFTEQVNAVNKSLISYIYEDPDINQYLMHIQNTLKKNLHNMFPTELYKIHSGFYDIITTDIGSNTPISEKRNKIIQSTLSTKDKIYDMLNGKLKKSISPMTIKPNSVNGWGTTSEQKDKILQYSSTQDIINQETSISSRMTQIVIELKQKKNFIMSCIDVFSDNYINIYYYMCRINIKCLCIHPINNAAVGANRYERNNGIPEREIIEVLKFRTDIEYIYDVDLTDMKRVEVKKSRGFLFRPLNASIRYADYNARVAIDNTISENYDGIVQPTDIPYVAYWYLAQLYYMIDANINILDQNMNDLIICIENENLYYTYELLVANIVSTILRLAMYISIYHTEIKDYIVNKVIKINELHEKYNSENKIASELYKNLYNIVITGDNSITTVLRQIEELYANLHETMNILNSYTTLLNHISTQRVIKKFTEVLDNTEYKLDDAIYSRPFQELVVIPKTRELFVQQFDGFDNDILFEKHKDNLTKFIKIMVERYMPQLTFLNHSSYINVDNRNAIDSFTINQTNADMVTIHHNNHTVYDYIEELERLCDYAKTLQPHPSRIQDLPYNAVVKAYTDILQKIQQIQREEENLIQYDEIGDVMSYIQNHVPVDRHPVRPRYDTFCELLNSNPLLATFIANHPGGISIEDDFCQFIDAAMKYPFETRDAFNEFVMRRADLAVVAAAFPEIANHINGQQIQRYINGHISIALGSLLAFDTPEGAQFVLIDYAKHGVNDEDLIPAVLAIPGAPVAQQVPAMVINKFMDYFLDLGTKENAIKFLETLLGGGDITRTEFYIKFDTEQALAKTQALQDAANRLGHMTHVMSILTPLHNERLRLNEVARLARADGRRADAQQAMDEKNAIKRQIRVELSNNHIQGDVETGYAEAQRIYANAQAHEHAVRNYNHNPAQFFETHKPYSIAFAKFLLTNQDIIELLKFNTIEIIDCIAFARVAALSPTSANAFINSPDRQEIIEYNEATVRAARAAAAGAHGAGVPVGAQDAAVALADENIRNGFNKFVKFMGITPNGANFAINHWDTADNFITYINVVGNEDDAEQYILLFIKGFEGADATNYNRNHAQHSDIIKEHKITSKHFLLYIVKNIIEFFINGITDAKNEISPSQLPVPAMQNVNDHFFNDVVQWAEEMHIIIKSFYQHINIYQYDKMPGSIYGWLKDYPTQRDLVKQITSITRMRHIYRTETIGVVPEQSNVHMGILDEMGSYGQHNLLYLKDNYYKGDVKLGQYLTKTGHTIVIENRANKLKTEEAYPVVGTLLDTYIHIIKYWIVRDIIEKIHTPPRIAPTMQTLIDAIKTYKDKYIEETGVDTIEDNIIYTMIGKMIDTAMMTFIKSCMHQTAVHHTISYMGHMKENKFAAEIFQEIKVGKVLLFKPETNYKVELQKLTEELYHQINDDPNYNADKIYELNYADALMKDKVDDETKNQHIIYNYTYNTKTVANKCSKIVPEVLDILMENGNVRINAKDNSGNTALYYAVGIQHYAIIEKMLKMNVSVNNSLSRNNIGMTPFEYSLSLYKMHLEIMSDPSQLIKEMNNKVKDYVRKKPEYKNNMIKHGDNIFAQILYMLNHEFYMMSKQYKNSWTYDKHKKLLSDLTKLQITDPEDTVNKAISPIIHYIEKLKSTGANGTQAIEGRKQYADIQIKKLTEEISECNERIKSLTAEQTDIASKLGDKYYQDRNAEITELIADIQKEIVEKQTKLTTWESRKKESETNFTKFTPTIVQKIAGRKTLKKAKRADELYESIFKEVINKQIPDVARQVLDSLQDQTFIDNIMTVCRVRHDIDNVYNAIIYVIIPNIFDMLPIMIDVCFGEIIVALVLDDAQKNQINENFRRFKLLLPSIIHFPIRVYAPQPQVNAIPPVTETALDTDRDTAMNDNIQKAIVEAIQIAHTKTKEIPLPQLDIIRTSIQNKIRTYSEKTYSEIYKMATKYIFNICINAIIGFLRTIMGFSQDEYTRLLDLSYNYHFTQDPESLYNFLLDPNNYIFQALPPPPPGHPHPPPPHPGTPPDSLKNQGAIQSVPAVLQAIDTATQSVPSKLSILKSKFAVILDTITTDVLDNRNIQNLIGQQATVLTDEIATQISTRAHNIAATPPAAAPLAAPPAAPPAALPVVSQQIAKFKYTNDKDYESYKILWDLYIKDTKKNDTLMNLHIILLKYAKKLISEYEMKKMGIKEIKDNVETIYELHDGLLNRFASDYDTLPLEYSEQENYALTRALDILVHVVRHNICTTMYNVIAKNLALYVMNTHEFNHGIIFTDEKEYSRYINGIVDEILSNGKHDEKLMAKYVIGDMPKKAVKIITGIYEGDDDPDRLIGRVLNLFKQITDILMLNNTVKIESVSPIIRMLDDVFYPYFEDLLTQYITDGKNMVDSYMKYIMTETRQIRIMKQCAEQAMKETDIQQ